MSYYRVTAHCAAFFLLLACEQDDLGNPCPLETPVLEASPTDNAVDYPAVVEVNTSFPCNSLTCVSLTGRAPYCSRECISDSNCPAAFECRVVTDLEPFEGRQYCVWRGCRVSVECGDVARYDCVEGNYGPDAPPGLCGLLPEATE